MRMLFLVGSRINWKSYKAVGSWLDTNFSFDKADKKTYTSDLKSMVHRAF